MSKLALLGGEKIRTKPFASGASIGDEERRRVNEVLDCGILSGFVANATDSFYGGKQVKDFEQSVKDYFQVKHAVSVNSATAGLHIGLAACGISPGDEVIVTPYTMAASATAIVMNQAIPVFADIEETSFCLDPQSIQKNISPKTKAIVVVHLFGKSAQMDQIMAIAKKHNLAVIEDCAQSPGAYFGDKPVGTIGDIGIFSLNQHKTITCGEGGYCLTNDDQLAKRMQLIRNHGEAIVASMGVSDISNIVGLNYRMTELEAAVACGQFKSLDRLNNHRFDLAMKLTEKLRDYKELILPDVASVKDHVFFVYPIKYLAGDLIPRDLFVKALVAEGIPFGGGYVKPIYMEPMYQQRIAYGKAHWPFSLMREDISYAEGLCPVTERMHKKELIVTALCRYPHSESDINDIANAVDKVFNYAADLKSACV